LSTHLYVGIRKNKEERKKEKVTIDEARKAYRDVRGVKKEEWCD